ncbi:MAG: VCBS repeat-containing protein [Cyclobacteriaceae bacterium]
MRLLQLATLTTLSLVMLGACTREEPTLFKLLEPEASGVQFINTITENDTFNILKEEYVYNGGGVGIGDFNNDGLEDIYFTGNMVNNALYLNEGELSFRDITAEAGVAGEGRWCSGVAVVDINNDGWQDIYVSTTIYKEPERRKNLLYINQGINEAGIPTFKEMAEAYGIADDGNTTQAAFFDYDLDGDLDLYLLTNVIDTKLPGSYRKKLEDGSSINNDRLYRNDGVGADGHPVFTNVSKEAGILIEGFGLGITVSDINLDGWPDIYISNDYISNDLLYINNQDGTFTNRIEDYLNHTSHSAMGSDVVDFNNDGLVDIIALDMLPENNQRQKQMLGPNNYMTYINNAQFGYQHQYVRNTLQLNQGMSPEGHPVFSEIGHMANIYQTDWSWTPLVADFDNDGYKDLIITNGFPKDVTDRDFASYRSGPAGNVASMMYLQNLIPVVKIPNYAYRNTGDLRFDDQTEAWGLNQPSFSNGAAYVDLDNDGDLDFVVNNINDPASVYENQLYKSDQKEQPNHYLRVKFKGKSSDAETIGAKVIINYGQGKTQYVENARVRGYLSSTENAAHFGLGTYEIVDSLRVFWPGGAYQLLTDVRADQVITLDIAEAEKKEVEIDQELPMNASQSLFTEASRQLGIQYLHQEEDKIDFNLQRTLPRKYTQMGPGLSVGDVNGDGLEDFYIGGSAGNEGVLYLQQEDGTFADRQKIGQASKAGEGASSLFFDADNDGDLDLYLGMGSYEFIDDFAPNQDMLYINDGQGNFSYRPEALPVFTTVSSAVRAADYDQDGDLDLFVGGRVIPGAYPRPSSSYILRNDGGTFTDVTQDVAPYLKDFGLVSDALWTDFDQDGKIDLLIAAEWQPLIFLKNTGESFENISAESGIGDKKGWWTSLTAGDFDRDGDIDYIAGNLGLNSSYQASEQYPLSVYAKDFDDNGGYDAIIVKYIKDKAGQMRPYPVHSLDVMLSQMIGFKRDFQKYEKYGKATIDSLLNDDMLEDALVYQANHMASSYIENLGGGKFAIKALPTEAQIAPLYGMLSQDVNGDGKLDLLAVGNDYGTEVFTGRYDALKGLYLQGDGRGGFVPAGLGRSGFYVPGDAKALVTLKNKQGEQVYLASQNQDSLRVMTINEGRDISTISLEPLDAWAEISYRDGSKERRELYYGTSYLSQSGRSISLSPEMKSLLIYDYQGNKREIIPDQQQARIQP